MVNQTPTKEEILDALRAVKYPGFSRDIVSFGIVRDLAQKVRLAAKAATETIPELIVR